MFSVWVMSSESREEMFRRKREMEALSLVLEKLINDEPIDSMQGDKDTLPSKIRHQMIRLSDKMRGNEEQLIKDRDEIKGLISEIAHQLRNPLANMEGYLQLLEEGAGSRERESAYIDAIAVSERRIRFLTESFIKMARLESKVIQIKKESADLKKTLLRSILQVQGAAVEKKIDIRLQMDENLRIPHDANWLSEAVFNLLDNSIKYSSSSSYVDMKAEVNEMFAEISVTDSGMGIEQGEENLIFQRFYRGKKVTSQEGFGLGLYLAREIVLQHQGFMKVTRLKEGMKISIFLPA
ncbi:sensor histidine kinase [Emergencia timonensis]|uniref:histidine kinase n=2 Tax=Emergencia timonensis TaxID=1776384 RepID=A0A415E314_9FIRM|nr:sensor histidine kinase [Emergencia timonensis]